MTAAPRSAFVRSLGSRVELSFNFFQDKVLDELDALMPKSVVDAYSDTKKKRRACLGDIRVNKIRALLDTGFGGKVLHVLYNVSKGKKSIRIICVNTNLAFDPLPFFQ